MKTLGILAVVALAIPAVATGEETLSPPVYQRWETFRIADGLPSDKVFCVAVDGDRVWAGTDRGLARYEAGEWTVYTKKDGLTHDAVLALAVDPATRDLWAGTMGGLTHWSAGRFRGFT